MAEVGVEGRPYGIEPLVPALGRLPEVLVGVDHLGRLVQVVHFSLLG
jgi:hypothetical protein